MIARTKLLSQWLPSSFRNNRRLFEHAVHHTPFLTTNRNIALDNVYKSFQYVSLSVNYKDFSSQRLASNNSNIKKGKDTKGIMNENLISTLLKSGKTMEETLVRLVIDQARDEKSQISILSLKKAIEMSSALGVDLVGINLEQNPPVVKAVDYNKLLYKESKKSSSSGMKSSKEFKFKAGIANNDLQRKANNMLTYLQKGHSCQVVFFSNRRNLMSDINAVETTLERVKELVGDFGLCQGSLKKNEIGNRGSIMFQPNLKKR